MAFKLNRWAVVTGGVFLAAAVILWWTAAVPAEEQIRRAVLAEVRSQLSARGGKEGVDFTIGAIEIFFREDRRALAQTGVTPSPLPWFHDVVKRGGQWIVSKKLDNDFREFVHDEANFQRIIERLFQRVRGRHGSLSQAKPPKEGKYPIRSSVRRLPAGIAGTCEVAFWYSLTKEEKTHGRFHQDFLYENGTWVFGSGGQLFDVPNPPGK